MKTQTTTGGSSEPTVHLTTKKSRRKLYNKETTQPIYYLKDGEEFELEIFNPTQFVLRTDISINNKILNGGGLVIKPGERVFLDRYLDTPKKFKFETYEVGNSNEVEQAIKPNGSIKVEFHKEQIYNNYTTYNPPHTIYYNNTGNPYLGDMTFTTSATTANFNVDYTNTSISGVVGTVTTDSMEDVDTSILRGNLSRKSKKKETGRVGQGSNSNQEFKTVNLDFEIFSSFTTEFKILPLSEKQTTVQDLNVKRYCTQCSAKVHKDWKFCPVCSTKI